MSVGPRDLYRENLKKWKVRKISFFCQSRSNFEINANLDCCECSVSYNGENKRFTKIVDKNFTELCGNFSDSPNLLSR